jgi:hypothetical protein
MNLEFVKASGWASWWTVGSGVAFSKTCFIFGLPLDILIDVSVWNSTFILPSQEQWIWSNELTHY